MTRQEQQDLLQVARSRERLAKAGIAARAAELEAEFELQIAAKYSSTASTPPRI